MASSGTVELDATISAGPPAVSEKTFPRNTTTISPRLRSCPKAALVQTGDKVAEMTNSSAFVALPGVGSASEVSQASFLYIATMVPMILRITSKERGGGSDLVAVLPIGGPLILEVDVLDYIKLVEVKGVGTVNWYASGSQ